MNRRQCVACEKLRCLFSSNVNRPLEIFWPKKKKLIKTNIVKISPLWTCAQSSQASSEQAHKRKSLEFDINMRERKKQIKFFLNRNVICESSEADNQFDDFHILYWFLFQ